MSSKDSILSKIRESVGRTYGMPSFDSVRGVRYPDPAEQFARMSAAAGGQVVEAGPGESLDGIIRRLYPEAKEIASNVEGITIATKNPDTVDEAQELNGTDVGVLRGSFGVAENGCVWIPQTMKERAVCFISEYLVIIVSRSAIVSNMHEAYARMEMNGYGYGCFISGPSKTADIAQALVMGAQAARGVTVILTD